MDGLLPVHADYLCGNAIYGGDNKSTGVARGIPAENIHSEAFGTGGVNSANRCLAFV